MTPSFFSPEHLHVMSNHFPVTLSLLVPPILLAGIFFHRGSILAVGFSLGLLADLATPVVMQSGESAHTRFEMSEIKPPLDEEGDIAAEMHEDMAEKASKLLYLMGWVCIVGLIILKFRPAWRTGTAWVVILIALGAAFFSTQAALLGGRIRHPEFRIPHNPAPEHSRND
ncbi:MAG: hypothetical protein EBT57_02840 [Verrucomicrobia bacterium]|nr:hypothetical protein [Verrucomicrobiota bacterium]